MGCRTAPPQAEVEAKTAQLLGRDDFGLPEGAEKRARTDEGPAPLEFPAGEAAPVAALGLAPAVALGAAPAVMPAVGLAAPAVVLAAQQPPEPPMPVVRLV